MISEQYATDDKFTITGEYIMKNTALLLATTLLFLTSCATVPVEESNTLNTSINDTMSSETTVMAQTTAAETEPSEPEGTVIIEDDLCRFKYYGMRRDDDGLIILDLSMDNLMENGKIDITLYAAKVNGMKTMATLFRYNEGYGGAPALSGTKAGSSLNFMLKTTTYGIQELELLSSSKDVEPTDIELFFRLGRSNMILSSHIYPQGEEKARKDSYQMKKDDAVILDNDYVRIIRLSTQTPRDDELYEGNAISLPVAIENKTESDLLLEVKNVKIDGVVYENSKTLFGKLDNAVQCALNNAVCYDNFGFEEYLMDTVGAPDISTIKKIEFDVFIRKPKNGVYNIQYIDTEEVDITHVELDY